MIAVLEELDLLKLLISFVMSVQLIALPVKLYPGKKFALNVSLATIFLNSNSRYLVKRTLIFMTPSKEILAGQEP